MRGKVVQALEKQEEQDRKPLPTTPPPATDTSPPAPEPTAATSTASPLPIPVPAHDEAPAHEVTPLYKKWWLWTIVGAVVVGGVTTAAVVGSQGDSREPVTNGGDWPK